MGVLAFTDSEPRGMLYFTAADAARNIPASCHGPGHME